MSATTRYGYPLSLPASLKETAARLAREDGVSLNQWIATAVAQRIGAVETAEVFLAERAARANPGDLQRYLDGALDTPPAPGDEMPEAWLLGIGPPVEGRSAPCCAPITRRKGRFPHLYCLDRIHLSRLALRFTTQGSP